ncbi:hypothetical protein [Actinoallomurus vinaceus]|uniref:hypothetical protein n=1 Tax=Actinoallomurus vinaceus TaxID=1080074 RepID=UPI0031EBEEF8
MRRGSLVVLLVPAARRTSRGGGGDARTPRLSATTPAVAATPRADRSSSRIRAVRPS